MVSRSASTERLFIFNYCIQFIPITNDGNFIAPYQIPLNLHSCYSPAPLDHTLIHISPELLQRFKSGDEQAFSVIYDRFYYSIFQYSRQWLKDSRDAEDVTADTFVQLFRHRQKFVSFSNIEAFLKVTVRNACFNNLRYHRVRTNKQDELIYQLSQEGQPDFGWVETEEAFLNLIFAEVEKLPEKMKQIFLLSFKDGLKPAQIAEKLGIEVRTVSNQKTNAIRILKSAVSKHSHLVVFLWLLDK